MNEWEGMRIAAYVRVSTEEQARHGLSVDTQTRDLQKWANSNGVKFVGIYPDAGFSARKKYSTRPEMVRLLGDITDGKIDVVVFTKLDRWFRNISDYYKVQEILEEHGCSWRAIYEDYETETAAGRLKVNIMLAVAQDEADRTSERIKAVFAHKKEMGELTFGSVPFGYRKVGKDVEFDPDAEPVMRLFFATMLEGNSVSRTLQTVYNQTGVKISRALAYRMRRLESYTGSYHGIQIPAYITPEQHQRLLDGIGAAPKMVPGNHIFLFSGLIYCGECGSRMPAHAQPHRRMETIDYQCRKYAYHGPCENRTCIMERTVEAHLLNTLDNAIIASKNEEAASENREQLDRLNAQQEAIKRKLSRLKDLYIAELIDMGEYKTDYAALTEQLGDIAVRIGRYSAPQRASVAAEKLSADWKELYHDLDRQHRADFWRSIIKRVLVYRDRSISYELL